MSEARPYGGFGTHASGVLDRNDATAARRRRRRYGRPPGRPFPLRAPAGKLARRYLRATPQRLIAPKVVREDSSTVTGSPLTRVGVKVAWRAAVTAADCNNG